MYKFLLFVSLNLFFLSSFSQSLTNTFVKNWLKDKDASFNLDSTKMLYVIDNFTYDDIKADSILRTWSVNKLLHIDYLKPTNVFCKPSPPVIIICSKHQLNEASVKYKLRKARRLLESDSLLAKPILYVNDILVDPLKVIDTLKDINWKAIYCIDVDESLNPDGIIERYEANGIIRIWTKNLY